MRQLYENKDTLAQESIIAGELTAAWNCELKKLPISYYLDFAALVNGEIKAWVEVRRRSHKYGTFPTYMLSVLKWRHGIELSAATKLPFILVIGYDDGVYYYRYSPDSPIKFNWGGRKHLRDSADVEPVVHIPMEYFKKL